MEIIPLAVLIINGHRVTSANSAAVRFIGTPQKELVGKNIADLVSFSDPGNWDEMFRRLSGNPDLRQDCEFLRQDLVLIQGEVFVRPLSGDRWLVFINDISSRRQAEMSLLAAEEQRWKINKKEGLERLAAGIAHDFNNFLAVILLHTDMLNLQLGDDSPFRRHVNEIKAVSNDAAGIVRQLLAFGQKQTLNPAPVVLNNTIQDAARALNALVGDRINVELSLDPDLGVCFVDQNQFAQALMYLAINTKDAISDEGLLRIETANVNLDRKDTHKSQWSGSYVQISVTDSGRGMNSQTEENIFDPFFSTKASDKGAGLGLATVYGIVKQSGGFIWVESELGHGTTFKIQFPRVDQPQIIKEKAEKANNVATANPADKTVLLVDDERSVRRVVAEILRKSGLKVLEAGSGIEAIEIAGALREPIHLILTDFSMPKMDGKETAQKVKKLHPETMVLFMSGDDIDPGQTGFKHLNAACLTKPFSSSGLTKKV
ncbi:MAG TPA: response regulator, partial [Pyrinomonadaceae bacterium]|nr:response regulator [Pyrinomonadaceae bacterium]